MEKIKNSIELVQPSSAAAEIIGKLDSRWKRYSQMLPHERMFLAEMVQRAKPKTMVEIGVCGGGSSVIMLQASSEWGGQLASVDVAKLCYDAKDKPCGYAITMFPELEQRWQGYFGHRVFSYIEDIIDKQFKGKPIDFVLLDGQHRYPGEVLDFICIFPYLSPNATIVIHDIAFDTLNIHMFCILRGHKCLAVQYEYPYCGKVVDFRTSENGLGIIRTLCSNIGAITLDPSQRDNMYDLFHDLLSKWSCSLPSDELQVLTQLIEKNYDSYFVTMWGKILAHQGQQM